MSLLDTASLIVTPNGYKEGKLYSVIPSDGSGDMSVSRATTATRVNSAGLVELVPYNLVQQSNTFNVTWASAGPGATITIGQTDPDGGSNAWLLTKLGLTGRIQQSVNVGGVQTFFIYAKKNTSDFIQITIFDGILAHECWFNLSTGVVGTQNSSTGAIESVGGGWYKCSITSTNNAAAGIIQIYQSEANGIVSGITGSISIFNSQLNEGSSALPYQKTETRLNIPRLDYSNGTCPSLLVEPQRTNLALYSSSFDNAAWVKAAATISANSTTSPSGIQDADTLIENTANTNHLITQAAGGGGVATYSISVFAKSFSADRYLQIWVGNTVNAAAWIRIDLDNGLITQNNGLAGTGYSIASSSIEDYGSGWYRCVLVVNKLNTTGTNTVQFRLSQISTGVESNTYLGNGTSGFYIWGAQAEVGSYPTSYIPTTSASVTRNADVISKTGISSLIGQTEGTLFLDFDFTNISGVQVILSIHDSANNKRLEIWANNNILYGFIGGSVNITIGSLTIANGRHKVALGYKQSGDQVFYIDGVQIGASATTYTIAALTSMIFGYWSGSVLNPNAEINATALWQTRLTNTQLATLTTI